MNTPELVLPPKYPGARSEGPLPDHIPLQAGYGSCSARGCGCGGFQPTGRGTDYCAFCNHHWGMHR